MTLRVDVLVAADMPPTRAQPQSMVLALKKCRVLTLLQMMIYMHYWAGHRRLLVMVWKLAMMMGQAKEAYLELVTCIALPPHCRCGQLRF